MSLSSSCRWLFCQKNLFFPHGQKNRKIVKKFPKFFVFLGGGKCQTLHFFGKNMQYLGIKFAKICIFGDKICKNLHYFGLKFPPTHIHPLLVFSKIFSSNLWLITAIKGDVIECCGLVTDFVGHNPVSSEPSVVDN